MIKNLVFQIRVKILAEKIGLKAVVKEGSDIVLKFPPLPANVEDRNLPKITLLTGNVQIFSEYE